MLSLQLSIAPKPCSTLSAMNIHHNSCTLPPIPSSTLSTVSYPFQNLFSSIHYSHVSKTIPCFAISSKSDSKPDPDPNSKSKAKARRQNKNPGVSRNNDENFDKTFPTTIPKKPRRGRRSEAVAVEDFVRDSLERTFESIRQQNPEVFENKENVMKERLDDEFDSDNSSDEDDDDNEDRERKGNKMVVEEDDPDWPLDADVGWGIRASEYFEQRAIKNVVGEDGFEIDWEGEIDDSWVKEINCLEWESFAFHPSPLIVLVFERYNRATQNWKTLKELEKAIQVYWNAKDRLPPRAVKLDMNIERDLAYALKVRECPQILFLHGNRIVYREKGRVLRFMLKSYKKNRQSNVAIPIWCYNLMRVLAEFRRADELVQMIAYFYYNAKKPSYIDEAALSG